ncbi:MgtC/SapB family protein [Parvularcula dongshanensis]|uniref:Protein MgtC n=1 Tax=Parvularcula dongshanensis TaxID=1173995 RepID=A0A840I118_9PROT|nr:MgtC/SapB family protein [Parvularcula dongshanensis]MBB4657973.1 putative Mg2+ transporter-C (MgtC) family protein [Parvularcula dongshanensis]
MRSLFGKTSRTELDREAWCQGYEVTRRGLSIEAFGYTQSELGLIPTAVRLLLAAALSGALGLERERRERPAGLRTYMLTALAACLFTLMTLEISLGFTRDDMVVADPVRIVNAVTAGVAFLAAGTIISRGRQVVGLTTGAGMWMSGAIGVAAGLGHYPAAAMTCVLTLAVLIGLRRIETGSTKHDEKARGD